MSDNPAVITGGTTGIGLAAAKCFVGGRRLCLNLRPSAGGAGQHLGQNGTKRPRDTGLIASEADLDRLYATVKAERGTLDVVFANAGTGGSLKLGDINAEHIDDTFDTNVNGTIYTVQKALPLMAADGSTILKGQVPARRACRCSPPTAPARRPSATLPALGLRI